MEQPDMPQPYTPPNPAALLPSSTLATTSLVAGILGFTFVPLIGGIVALVTGYMARKETRAVPPAASGDGMATAGIVMGWIQVGLAVVGFCCFVAWFVFVVGLAGSSLQGQ
jgi:hypothetical protein